MSTRSAKKGARTPSSVSSVRQNALRIINENGGDGAPLDPTLFWRSTRNKGFESFDGLSSEEEYEEQEEFYEEEVPETPASALGNSVRQSTRRKSLGVSTGVKQTPASSTMPDDDENGDGEDDSDDRIVPQPMQTLSKRLSFGGALRDTSNSKSDSTTKPTNRRASRGGAKNRDAEEDEEEEDEAPTPKASTTRASRSKAKATVEDDAEEDASDFQPAGEESAGADDMAVDFAQNDYEVSVFDDDEEEKSVSVAGRRNTRTAIRGRSSRQTHDDDLEDEDDVVKPKDKRQQAKETAAAAKTAKAAAAATKAQEKPAAKGRSKAVVETESEEDEPAPPTRAAKAAASTKEKPVERKSTKKPVVEEQPEEDAEEEREPAPKAKKAGRKPAAKQQETDSDEPVVSKAAKSASAAQKAVQKETATRKPAEPAAPAAENAPKRGRPRKDAAVSATESVVVEKPAKQTEKAPEVASSKSKAPTAQSKGKEKEKVSDDETENGKEKTKAAKSSKETEKASSTKASEKASAKPEKEKPAAKETKQSKETSKSTKPTKVSEPQVEDLDTVAADDYNFGDTMDYGQYDDDQLVEAATKSSSSTSVAAAKASAKQQQSTKVSSKGVSEKPAESKKDGSKKRKRSPSPTRDEETAALAATLRNEVMALGDDIDQDDLLAAARASASTAKTKAERRKSVFVPQRISTPELSQSRRSQRRTVPPLAFWKNERIEYEEDEQGLPTAKTVIKKVKPPVLNEDGEIMDDQDPYMTAPSAKRPKQAGEIVFADIANPEANEIQTLPIVAPGDWIKYGPRDEWVPFAEHETYEASSTLAFYIHRDTMSESCVLEILPGTDLLLHNSTYHGRRTITGLSGTSILSIGTVQTILKSGSLAFVPATNPFQISNTGRKPAYVSMSTIFYTM